MAIAAKVANWVFAAFLILVGGYLAIRGFELFSLGGSWYYAMTGVLMVAVAVLIVLQNRWAPKLYAIFLAVTAVWALWESGMDPTALLPRLAFWLGLGLWFLMPWFSSYMKKDEFGPRIIGGVWVGAAGLVGVVLLAVAMMQSYRVEEGTNVSVAVGPEITDWRHYGNSEGGTRFSQVDQINLENVGDLEEVWRLRTGVAYDYKNTPLQVGGLIYTCTAGTQVIAVDPDTGEEVWRYDPKTKVPSRDGTLDTASTFARTCRGVGYHEAPPNHEGQCAKRIVLGTTDARLIAIDAITGRKCTDFGFDGEVNLKSGLRSSTAEVPVGEYMMTSVPLIAGNVAVVGGWVTDNQQLGNVSGVLRAYDVLTGQFAWAWDMGNPTYRGLPDEGGEYTRGTPNVWSIMSYDPDLNLLYAPTGNASPDYFGGKRREFDEKYSASTVALDAATGEIRWTYQTVHHDIWDYDVPSQPVLVNITKDGEKIPAVAQPTKRGEIFLLDRRDGSPIWPAETCPDGSPAAAGGECKVPQGTVDGDYVTATQPFSALPNFRPFRAEKDMWGVTPLDHLYCRIEYKKMRYEGHFTPPMRGGGGGDEATYGGSFQYPGNAGGFNWPSVSVDADNGLLIAQPMLMGNRITMVSMADMAARAGAAAPPPRDEHEGDAPAEAPAERPARPAAPAPYTAQGEWDPQTARLGLTSPFMNEWKIPLLGIAANVPCFEPPYGRLAVIDLNQNKLLWSRRIGTMLDNGPFGIKPGLPFMVGTPIYGGTMNTRGGLIFQTGSMDRTFRAIDKRTGKIKWQEVLPGTANSTPITFISPKTGRQYVVISIPNPGFEYPRGSAEPSDDKGGWLIGYALPE